MQYLQETQASELESVLYCICFVHNQIRIKGNQSFPLSSKMSIKITKGIHYAGESMFKYVYVCYRIKYVPRYNSDNLIFWTPEFLKVLSPLKRLVFNPRQPCRTQGRWERFLRTTFTSLLITIYVKQRQAYMMLLLTKIKYLDVDSRRWQLA